MRRFLIPSILILVLLSLGCTGSDIVPIAVKEKKPDIRVVNTNFESDLSLSEGVFAKGTYTLANYGDANGIARIAFVGDYSGTISQDTVFVPAGDSVTKNVRLDIDRRDESLQVKILSQSKS